MKKFFTLLVYLSFIFLIWYFYKQGFFVLEGLNFHIPRLVISILLLWLGFLLSAMSWRNALRIYDHRINGFTAIYSHGLPVFTKYIPGKVWTILGRASYAMPSKDLFREFTFISLKEQLVYIWTGLLISIFPLMVYRGPDTYTLLVSLLFAFVSLVIFNKWFHGFSLGLLKSLFKRSLDIPFVGFRESLSIILFCTLYWGAWILAFYALAISVFDEIPFAVSLVFPLSVTLGLLAIFFPGGIGVREGVLTGFMVLIGVTVEQAATLSILSRLWFSIGEILIFFSALAVRRMGPSTSF